MSEPSVTVTVKISTDLLRLARTNPEDRESLSKLVGKIAVKDAIDAFPDAARYVGLSE